MNMMDYLIISKDLQMVVGSVFGYDAACKMAGGLDPDGSYGDGMITDSNLYYIQSRQSRQGIRHGL